MASTRELFPVRSGAIALWLAGPLLTVAVTPHPTILNGGVGDVVRTTGSWATLHLCAGAGVALGWWGIACVVVLHRRALREWALPILAVATVGAFVMVAVMLLEAFTFPVLAREAPHTLELDGPLFASWTFRLVSSLAGGFLISLVALGLALARRGIWAKEGTALAVTTVAFMALAGPFVPVLGPLSTIALAWAAARVGLLLWRADAAMSLPEPIVRV